MSSIPTLVLAAALAAMLATYAAMPGPQFHRATTMGPSRRRRRGPSVAPRALLMVAAGPDDLDRAPGRPIRVPFTSSDPLAKHRAVTGINAHVRWYQRVASLVGIALLVGLMGVLLAASIGAFYIAVRIVLELVVG